MFWFEDVFHLFRAVSPWGLLCRPVRSKTVDDRQKMEEVARATAAAWLLEKICFGGGFGVVFDLFMMLLGLVVSWFLVVSRWFLGCFWLVLGAYRSCPRQVSDIACRLM